MKGEMNYKKLIVPNPSIPKSIETVPESEEYQVSVKTNQRYMEWDFVNEQMMNTKYYWMATTHEKHGPHTVPIWGIWYENRLFFGGSPKAKWVKNVMRNPHVSLHTPNPELVCIIKGRVSIVKDVGMNDKTWNEIDTKFRAKYERYDGPPYMFIEPAKILTWNVEHMDKMTLWNFQ